MNQCCTNCGVPLIRAVESGLCARCEDKRHRGRPPQDGAAAKGWIQLRVTMTRKNAYVRAAKPRKLTEWIFSILDKAAGYRNEDV